MNMNRHMLFCLCFRFAFPCFREQYLPHWYLLSDKELFSGCLAMCLITSLLFWLLFIFTGSQLSSWRTRRWHWELLYCFALIPLPYFTHQYILRVCMPCVPLEDCISSWGVRITLQPFGLLSLDLQGRMGCLMLAIFVSRQCIGPMKQLLLGSMLVQPCWFLFLGLCVACLSFSPLLLFKPMVTSTCVWEGFQMKWGLGAKQDFLYSTTIFKVIIGIISAFDTKKEKIKNKESRFLFFKKEGRMPVSSSKPSADCCQEERLTLMFLLSQGSGFLEVFSSKTNSKLCSCVPNIISCFLHNHTLCEAVAWVFCLTWVLGILS